MAGIEVALGTAEERPERQGIEGKMEQGTAVTVSVPGAAFKRKIIGKGFDNVIGAGITDINESYIVECTDGTIPNDYYRYSTYSVPLSSITVDEVDDKDNEDSYKKVACKAQVPADWNDGYWLEAMDRCHTMSVIAHKLFDQHPGILRTPGGPDMSEQVFSHIQKLYQAIGRAEDEARAQEQPVDKSPEGDK